MNRAGQLPRPERGARAHRAGLAAERLAALWLRLKGYRILARRWRSPAGELDLVACKGGIIAFVEVKGRGDAQTAAEALSRRQRLRLERAAGDFLRHHSRFAALSPRFDVFLVVAGHRPVHLRDAWRPQN